MNSWILQTKKMLLMAITSATLSFTASQVLAYSETYETIDLGIGSFYLAPGETRTVTLPGREWRRVQKVYIQASGYRGSAIFEVMSNGDAKGTIYVPGLDPSYLVTIGEVTSSIQLRHVQGAYVNVQNIKLVVATRPVDGQFPGFPGEPSTQFPSYNEGTRYSLEAIRLVDALEHFANYSEYGVYLLPIKKSAALAYAASSARGSVGQKVHDLLMSLKLQIDFATAYLDDSFERDSAFGYAVQLKALSEKLDMVLR